MTNPDDLWCVQHNVYAERCLWRHGNWIHLHGLIRCQGIKYGPVATP